MSNVTEKQLWQILSISDKLGLLETQLEDLHLDVVTSDDITNPQDHHNENHLEEACELINKARRLLETIQ